MESTDALGRADAAPFDEQLERLADSGQRDRGALDAISRSFAVCALTSQAAVALATVSVLTEPGAFDLASIALHKRSIQQPVRVVKTPPANTGYFHSLTRHLVKIV